MVCLISLIFLISFAKASDVGSVSSTQTIQIVSQTYIDSYLNWDFKQVDDRTWTASFTMDSAFFSSTKNCTVMTGTSRTSCFSNLCDKYSKTSNGTAFDCTSDRTKLQADLLNMSNYPLKNLTAGISFSNFIIDMVNGNGSFKINFLDGFKENEGGKFGFGSTIVNSATLLDPQWGSGRNICRDSNNNLHAVFFYSSSVVKYANSTNNGSVWTVTTLDTGLTALYRNPHIDCNGDNISITYAQGTTSGILQYSTNAGGSWTEKTLIGNTILYDLICARRGSWFYCFYSTYNGNYGLNFTNSSNGGTTWSKTTLIAPTTYSPTFPSIWVNTTGNNLYVAYVKDTVSSSSDAVWFNVSNDNGATWNGSVAIPLVQYNGPVSINVNNTRTYVGIVHAGFLKLYFTNSTDGGKTWSVNETISTNPLTTAPVHSSVSIGNNNVGYPIVFWTEKAGSAKYNVTYRNLSATGWDAPAYFTADTTNNTAVSVSYDIDPISNYLDVLIENGTGATKNITYSFLDYTPVGGIQEYSREVYDSLTFMESYSKNTTLIRSVSDSIILIDSISRNATYFRSQMDYLAFMDITQRNLTLFRSSWDSFTFLDLALRNSTSFRSAADYLTFSDVGSRNITLIRAVSDSSHFVDFIVTNGSYSRFIFDTLTFKDAAARNTSLYVTVSDFITFIDLAQRGFQLTRDAYDSMAFSDAALRNLTFARSASDYLAFRDLTAINGSYSRLAYDALAFQSSTARNTSLSRSAYDYVILVDSTGRMLEMSRIAYDSMTFVDSLSRIRNVPRTASDCLGFSDSTNYTIEVKLVNVTYSNGSVTLVCNGSSMQNLTNVTLYLMQDGVWQANQTQNATGNESSANFTLSLPDGIYIWNCQWCTNSGCNFANQNQTLQLNDPPLPLFLSSIGAGLPAGGGYDMIGVFVVGLITFIFAYLSVHQEDSGWKLGYLLLSVVMMIVTLLVAVQEISTSNKVLVSATYNITTNTITYVHGNVTDTSGEQALLIALVNPMNWIIFAIISITLLAVIVGVMNYISKKFNSGKRG
ncbi:MAG: sialidase family protein [Candidatus Micrarchaeota archaeon]|nr:sialidase family protein [Candidatus Micrarchaeota archaeon]